MLANAVKTGGGCAMWLWDLLTGTKRPAEGVKPKSAQHVREALLAVNDPKLPFVVRDGAPEGVDFVAEWRIVDASWYGFFSKAGLKRTFKVLMRLDTENREVRAIDEEWSVEWSGGIPGLSRVSRWQRGQRVERSFEIGFGIKESGEPGVVYQYSFSTAELKTPLQNAVTSAGWVWRAVVFGCV
jgi:hypothetical protein